MKVFLGGIALVVLGFVFLSMVDPRGTNWASTLAPAFILLGYFGIAVGLILKDPSSLPPLA